MNLRVVNDTGNSASKEITFVKEFLKLIEEGKVRKFIIGYERNDNTAHKINSAMTHFEALGLLEFTKQIYIEQYVEEGLLNE